MLHVITLSQPHRFEILETLKEGSLVGSEIQSAVDDKDTIENTFFFYLISEEGE